MNFLTYIHFFLPLFYLVLFTSSVKTTPENPSLTFEHLYQFGKNEYTAESWTNCIAYFLRAIDDFNYFTSETLWCRKKCIRLQFFPSTIDGSDVSQADRLDADDWMTTKVMFAEAQRALCLLKCQQEKFTIERPPLDSYVIYNEFQKRKPHHYLQFCYWKLNDLPNAVKNAYTYLIENPKNEMTLNNLNFYMLQKGFNKDTMLVDLHQLEYEKSYIEGVNAYNNKNWESCIFKFQTSLTNFLKELENCRTNCEDQLDWSSFQNANPEISIVFTSLYTSFVRCRVNCLTRLNRINGRVINNFLATYFEYLHVCQFKSNRGHDACQSISSAILLDSSNILTRRNKFFYLKLYADPKLFEPISEILNLYIKNEREQRWLQFIDRKFQYKNNELELFHSDDVSPLGADHIDTTDSFDYTQLETTIITARECFLLENYGLIPELSNQLLIANLIIEIRQRVVQLYDSNSLLFKQIACTPSENKIGNQTGNEISSGCERGAFVIGLGTGIKSFAPCGAIMAENFSGCSIVFCIV